MYTSPNFFLNQHRHHFCFNPTNPTEIVNITKYIKSSRAQGHDKISSSLLKQIIHPIASPLNHIFNLSIATGVVPKSLKMAKGNSVFKKEDPHEMYNYRPISILPSISKILENNYLQKTIHIFEHQ